MVGRTTPRRTGPFAGSVLATVLVAAGALLVGPGSAGGRSASNPGCALFTPVSPGANPSPSALWSGAGPVSGMGAGGNVTNGEVERVWAEVCSLPSFESRFGAVGEHAFGWSLEGSASSGMVQLFFGFDWVGACPSPSAGNCSWQDNWPSWPQTGGVGADQLRSGPLICACAATPAPNTVSELPLVPSGAIVGAPLAVAGAVAGLWLWRRRSRRGPPPAAESTGSARTGPR